MISVLVTHPGDRLAEYFGDAAVEALRAFAEVRFNHARRDLSTRELVDAAQGCDAIIAYRQTPAPEPLFAGLPSLAAFLRCAVDVSTVNVAAASAHGVLVTHASPGFVTAVAEWVLGAMIALARGFNGYAPPAWRDALPVARMGRELRGATLGIIGYGRIGRRVTELAAAFGMHILVATPETVDAREGVRQVALGSLLSDADFVVCLAASTAQTRNLIDRDALAAMRGSAYFINASRGELVDEDALLAALQSGALAGCALDVGRAVDQMPSSALAADPRVLATPHIGGLTAPAITHQALETVAQLRMLVAGGMPEGALNAAHATRLERLRRSGA